ncbi:hypothetical protein [Candidatus Uabimicrobium sp. HlEnr_7]|uniref:hypothetical protein n=1 Tax=Candidatus Uabimicrobium helgolandensis TaxID=3095367 RepID=UPI0035591FBD
MIVFGADTITLYALREGKPRKYISSSNAAGVNDVTIWLTGSYPNDTVSFEIVVTNHRGIAATSIFLLNRH